MKTTYATENSTYSDVVILGGGYAGVLAALRLAGKMKKSSTTITLVNGNESFFERIRLHQRIANQPMRTLSLQKLLKGTGIQFVQGWATQLDPDRQSIKIQQAHSESEFQYQHLIYALGSSIDLESVEGVAQNTMSLASSAMVEKLGQAIPPLAEQKGSVVVVGGGLTGIETATELAESYPALKVTLATQGQLGSAFSSKGQAHLRRVCQRLNIQVKENLSVAKVVPGQLVARNGMIHPFDLCIWTAGFSVPQLAANSNITCDASGRVQVDAQLRSVNYPNIYAIGDSAYTPLRMACATALPMGAYAATHLAATLRREAEHPPFEFAYAVRCVSLGRSDALIQRVDAYDLPQEKIFSGRAAVLIKELICRYTVWSLKIEKLFSGAYQWPQAKLHMSGQNDEAQQFSPSHA